MTGQAFIELSEESGWDSAIEELERVNHTPDVKLLCAIYWSAYQSTDFQESLDPDNGLCFTIRQFVMERLCEML